MKKPTGHPRPWPLTPLLPWMVFYSFMLGALPGGCGLSEGDFTANADYDPCMDNIPVCQRTAGCILGEDKYTEGDFPGFCNFVVTTPADTTVVVKLFFERRKHPGEDTEIYWYEPGCRNYSYYGSMGADIFSLAGGDGVFAQEAKVRQAGDHLVEIYSDAVAHFLARVELKTPAD